MKQSNREIAKALYMLNQAVIMFLMDQPGDYKEDVAKIEKSNDRLREKFNLVCLD